MGKKGSRCCRSNLLDGDKVESFHLKNCFRDSDYHLVTGLSNEITLRSGAPDVTKWNVSGTVTLLSACADIYLQCELKQSFIMYFIEYDGNCIFDHII